MEGVRARCWEVEAEARLGVSGRKVQVRVPESVREPRASDKAAVFKGQCRVHDDADASESWTARSRAEMMQCDRENMSNVALFEQQPADSCRAMRCGCIPEELVREFLEDVEERSPLEEEKLAAPEPAAHAPSRPHRDDETSTTRRHIPTDNDDERRRTLTSELTRLLGQCVASASLSSAPARPRAAQAGRLQPAPSPYRQFAVCFALHHAPDSSLAPIRRCVDGRRASADTHHFDEFAVGERDALVGIPDVEARTLWEVKAEKSA
eukprot:2191211-Rhodomonas_salina.1